MLGFRFTFNQPTHSGPYRNKFQRQIRSGRAQPRQPDDENEKRPKTTRATTVSIDGVRQQS